MGNVNQIHKTINSALIRSPNRICKRDTTISPPRIAAVTLLAFAQLDFKRYFLFEGMF